MGKIYGREPALWMALVGAAWQVLSAFGFDFGDQTQSVITAVVSAALGLVVAIQVHDGIVAAISGLVTAGVSLVSYYALHWGAEDQAKLVGALMVIVAFVAVRPNVTAPVSSDVSPAGKLVA